MFNWLITKDFILKWWYKKWEIEKGFQYEILMLLKAMWCITYHIVDIWLHLKFLDSFFIDTMWVTRFIEFKKTIGSSFNINDFQPSQIQLLRNIEKRNSDLARVFIYSIKWNDYVVLKFSTIWNNRNDKWWVKIWDNKGSLILKNDLN